MHLWKYVLLATAIVFGSLHLLGLAITALSSESSIVARGAHEVEREYTLAKDLAKQERYADARRHVTSIRDMLRTQKLAKPEAFDSFATMCASMRLLEIEAAMRTAYHQYDIDRVRKLGEEALAIAKEDEVEMSDEILKITRKMSRGYVEPVFIAPEAKPKYLDSSNRFGGFFIYQRLIGKLTMKSVPFPLIDSTEIVPRMVRTISAVIQRPRPVPVMSLVSSLFTRKNF